MARARIAALRKALDLDPFAFAAMLGVAVSTVYRWESQHKRERKNPTLDPLHAQILAALHERDPQELAALGKKIRNALLAGRGTLGALYEVLSVVTVQRTKR